MEQTIETIIQNHIGNQNSFITPAGTNLFNKCVSEIEKEVKRKIINIVKSVKAGSKDDGNISATAEIVKDIIIKAVTNSNL